VNPDGVRARVAEKIKADFGDDWTLDHLETDQAGVVWAVARRRTTVTTIERDTPTRKVLRLDADIKASEGERFDADTGALFDAQNPDRPAGTSYRLVEFKPEAHHAAFEPLTQDEQWVRGVIASNVFRCKPWEVTVQEHKGGGFNVVLPPVYQPSKHDPLLEKVAVEVIGQPGWWCRFDGKTRRGTILPGELPTFPPSIPYPFDVLTRNRDPKSWARLPVGVILDQPGDHSHHVLATDFEAMPALQGSGIAGAGKGVVIMDLITGALAKGWEVALVDAVKSGVDFIDFAPFLKPGFFATNLVEAVTVLQMAYEEGQRRKTLIQEARVQKFTQLDGIRPLMVIVDEATSLFQNEPLPKGLPKDNPLVVEIAERNLLRATALNTMSKIPRELRFAGVSAVLFSQVASATVGIPTELRANLPAKFLLGSKPTPGNRKLALLNPDSVPEVPWWVAEDPDGAARGVGVFEFEGRAPGVFKAFFTPPTKLAAYLHGLGLPTSEDTRPTPQQIARYTPSLEPDLDDTSSGADWGQTRSPISGRSLSSIAHAMGDDWDVNPETGERTTGFERANLARHLSAKEGNNQ
jgi:hypothetical protein